MLFTIWLFLFGVGSFFWTRRSVQVARAEIAEGRYGPHFIKSKFSEKILMGNLSIAGVAVAWVTEPLATLCVTAAIAAIVGAVYLYNFIWHKYVIKE